MKDQKTGKRPAEGPPPGAGKDDAKRRKSKPAPAKPDPAPARSKPSDDDALFVRGGAPALTPLELKEISNKAAHDVLFESTAEEKSAAKRRSTKSKKDKAAAEASRTVKIEGLNHKNLTQGSIVLGSISAITNSGLSLSLPNNLTGSVDFSNISDPYTAALGSVMDVDSDSEGASDAGDATEALDIHKHYEVGQYLRSVVVSTVDEPANSTAPAKGKKRIALSINPRDANAGLTRKSTVVGCTIQAAVMSLEDHGLIMDIGSGQGFTGFLPYSDASKPKSSIFVGQVLLCIVVSIADGSKTVKLSAKVSEYASGKSKVAPWLKDAPSIDTFLPGTGVEVLVTEVGRNGGLAGKLMGSVDAVSDFMHSAGWLGKKTEAGKTVKGRILYSIANGEERKVGFSLLPHILTLESAGSVEVPKIGAYLEDGVVSCAEPSIGLMIKSIATPLYGFVHISRISSEERVENNSPTWRQFDVGTKHRARIIGFARTDRMLILSTEKSVLERKFLTIDDITPGEVIKGTIERAIPGRGLLVRVADDIVGFVEEIHISDVQVQNPEKKYKEGLSVKCRVLSTDTANRKLFLTMKKSLVNSDAKILANYDDATSGLQTVGTLVALSDKGAVVRFFGNVKAFLPVAEMSDAFINNPHDHFRVGQTVNIHITFVDQSSSQMRVSCRDPTAFSAERLASFAKLTLGKLATGVVTGKTKDAVMVDVEDSEVASLKGVLSLNQLSDSKTERAQQTMKRLRVGQSLKEFVTLSKIANSQMVELSMKQSIVDAVKMGRFPSSFEQMESGILYKGLIKSISAAGVLVRFAGNIRGFVPCRFIPAEKLALPKYGFEENDSVEVSLVSLEPAENRCTLSMLPLSATAEGTARQKLSEGTRVDARVVTVKATQLNVAIDGPTQGRVDITSIFESWDSIKSKKAPLKQFQAKQALDAVVIGIHDAKTHTFLPITHRKANSHTVYELSLKPASASVLNIDSLTVGMRVLGFVNNHASDGVWVSLSPSCRGFVRTLDMTDNTELLKDVQTNFPVGSALQCTVLKVDKETKRLDLTAKAAATQLDWESIKREMLLPGRVTRVSSDRILVNLSPEISGTVSLVDISDDYDFATTSRFSVNEIVTVCVVGVDIPKKRVFLSLRPSRTQKATGPIVDEEVRSAEQISSNTLRRGFVRSITDKGLFITLGEDVTAFVRVSNISDSFVKDWKPLFKVGQLVKGRIISCDKAVGKIEMSLKTSALSDDRALLQFSDLHVGQIVQGKVSGVAEYGVFINIEGSINLSGLCHKSEVSDEGSGNVAGLAVGDSVMAKVLSLDAVKKRISLGLKPSYFTSKALSEYSTDSPAEDSISEEEENGDVDEDEEGDARPVGEFNTAFETHTKQEALEVEVETVLENNKASARFDWSLSAFDEENTAEEDSDAQDKPTTKRKRRQVVKEDLTERLVKSGPESTSQFERAILESPQSSRLWIEYMSFLLRINEVEKAREIAERGLKRILSDTAEGQKEKLNVWIALLNMENEFGSEETLDAAFGRACQYNDDKDVFRKFVEILVASGKFEKADAVLKTYTKKYPTHAEPYILHAELLFSPPQPHPQQLKRARDILPQALTVIPKTSESAHTNLISKFALLEFKFGDPERGRTIFENLINRYPKRSDLFSIWIDQEIGLSRSNKAHSTFVRDLFTRTLDSKSCEFGTRGVRSLLKKWERWEQDIGGKESATHTAALEFSKVRKA